MNNPVIIGFISTDDPNFNPDQDPTPENWDKDMPPVKPYIVKVHQFDGELRFQFPGLDLWLKISDLKDFIAEY